MAGKLYAGDKFPELTFDLVDGGTVTVPADLESKYNIVLFYRGHW